MDYTDYIPPVIAKNPKASAAVIISTTYISLRFVRYVIGRMYLNSGVSLRRSEQVLNFWNVLKNFNKQSVEKTDEIVAWPYPVLKEKLQNGSISCVEVLRAYQRKATTAAAATNCVCLFIEEAMNRALELDNKAHDPNYQKPPLFGIPVSIKECIAYKGMDCTLGYVQDMSIPVKEHSAIVKQLLHLGAIPFVRTNNPLSLLTYGCTNAIYGPTCHPKDKNRVPGGSSGGEAALLSLGGSILGIGSDIGGSIRIPSTFCGLAGFKPTVDRFSHINNPGGIPGRVKIIANEGPMAPHIDTCIDYLKHVWDPEDLFLSSMDPYVPPVPWNEKLFSSEEPLTIGYYTYDGFFTAAPAYRRAVEECAKRLESMGHKLVPIDIPKADKAFQVLLAAILVDGGIFLNKKLDNDIVPSDCDYGFISRRMPIWAQRLLRPLIPWPRLRNMLGCLPRTPEEIRKVNADIDTYRREFLKLLQRAKVDCLLCPPMCMYPPAHEIPAKVPATTYTSLFNVLDFPAGVVPVTTVNEEDEKALADYPENDPFDREIKKQCKDCVGYPIGVQVAAPPYREEVALRALKLLQDSN